MAEASTDKDENEMKSLEKHIIKLILHIKRIRSRPCYQNLLSFLNREGKGLSIEELKIVTENILMKNLIKNTGEGDNESFALVEVVSEDVDETVNHDGGGRAGNVGALDTFIVSRYRIV